MTLYQEDSNVDSHNKHGDELSESMAWMPLEGIVEQWATFGGTYLTYTALMTTSTVFSAFSFEVSALQHYNEACKAQVNGAEITARAAFEQLIEDIQQTSSRWISALYWLERFASGSQHTVATLTLIRTLFSQATEQLERLGLLTQQVHQVSVLFYQQHGMLIDAQAREEQQ